MLTSQECFKQIGHPSKERDMVLWHVPQDIKYGPIPKRIYCNKRLVVPLYNALKLLKDRGLSHELKSWNGCFNIRKKRYGTTYSLHSWGLAIDINAATNRFGKKPTMPIEVVNCFLESGFDWGGYWKKPDGMHFQLKSI